MNEINELLARPRRAQDDAAEIKIKRVREMIRKNFPNPRAALTWRKETDSRIVSTCGRFAIERHGEGDTARYTAKLQPHGVIGVSLHSADLAKEICNRHASPLPLEDPAHAQREAERYPDR